MLMIWVSPLNFCKSNEKEVEEGYDGVQLGKSMTKQFISDMVQRFKDNKRIHKKYVSSPSQCEANSRSTE